MKRFTLIFAMAIFMLSAVAQSKLSPYSQLFLQHRAEKAAIQNPSRAGFVKTIRIRGVETIGTFITVNDDSDIAAIKSLGAVINARVGDIIMAQVPVDRLEAVAQLASVASVDVAKPVKADNDSARIFTNTNLVQTVTPGTGLSKAYKGAGIVVGIVDNGIDYNHINFKVAKGISRVKRVYQPDDTTGTSPVIDGNTLKGSEYTTPAQISALTTDNADQAHGTHVTGIAAGSYMRNNLYGIAPEADLVLCGCGDDLSDYNISMSITYIFNYAESVGKPAVVNLSLGNQYGPHDGSSPLTKVLDQLTGKGKIITISAGNEAGSNLHLYKKFTATDSVLQTVAMYNYSGSEYPVEYQDFWTRNTDYKTTPAIQFFVIAEDKDSILYTSPKFTASGVLDPATDSLFNNFYDNKIQVVMAKNANGKFEIVSEFNQMSARNSGYFIGLRYFCDSITSADVWDVFQKISFWNHNYSEYSAGDGEVSINNDATGNNTISVGAFNSKLDYLTISGIKVSDWFNMLGDIATFSSYGPDINGVTRPNVIAPGQVLISSFNSYYSYDAAYSSLCDSITLGGRIYCWGAMSGTSMAAPVVSGIIALWLQANPNLTPDDIKNVFNNSCKHDEYTTNNPQKSGYGKIDALAGLKYILNTTGIKGIRNDIAKPVLLYPNPSDGHFTVCTPSESGNVNMSIYNVAGALVYSRAFDGSNGAVDVNLNGAVAPGIYVLHLNGAITNYSSRLVLK
ncbi:MAG: S8 family peptidase [Muribaculaceae bacterium]|jgi:minor extracellular serine protease Vpr|nr:S8 family peptidase [Muribaculaceae bacterium]